MKPILRSALERFPGLNVTAVLLAVLLAVNALAVGGILAARRQAEQAALQELELQTAAHARALEAVLATHRGDFLFLSQSAPLSRAEEIFTSPDPVSRRWGRLDVEGTLLLFLDAHPAIHRMLLRDAEGQVVTAVGWRQGAPVLLRQDELEAQPEQGDRLLRSTWPVGSSPRPAFVLEATLDPQSLLAMAAPHLGERLVLEAPGNAVPGARREDGLLVARMEVADEGWTPPVRWTLVRREDESQVIRSVEELASRYRTTVLLNLAVMTLTLLLGLMAFRQIRRTARLEAERRQQARVRELERQVQHSERLASLGRLAAGIAHEINNPLEGLSNYLSLLEEDLKMGETREADLLLSRAREGLERIAGIVRQVLHFADPGRSPKTLLDLREVVERTLDFVRSNPAFRHLAVHQEIPGEPLPVLGNAITLGQLLLNLLLNACQVQPEGGEVTVAAHTEGDRVVVSVADRGPGFSAAALGHLFEPFFSTRGSTGLGLAVCHGIAVDHGGTLGVENRPGGGARILLKLPLAAASREDAEGAPAAAAVSSVPVL